jgi:hypothetical protein
MCSNGVPIGHPGCGGLDDRRSESAYVDRGPARSTVSMFTGEQPADNLTVIRCPEHKFLSPAALRTVVERLDAVAAKGDGSGLGPPLAVEVTPRRGHPPSPSASSTVLRAARTARAQSNCGPIWRPGITASACFIARSKPVAAVMMVDVAQTEMARTMERQPADLRRLSTTARRSRAIAALFSLWTVSSTDRPPALGTHRPEQDQARRVTRRPARGGRRRR